MFYKIVSAEEPKLAVLTSVVLLRELKCFAVLWASPVGVIGLL